MTATAEQLHQDYIHEAHASGEHLTEQVILIAERLANPEDAAYVHFRKTVGVKETPLERTTRIPVGGHTLYLKNETVQSGNAYKVRGATSALFAALEMNPDITTAVSATAGNHGLGVSIASTRSGLTSSAHMPRLASIVKQSALRANGTEVHAHYSSVAQSLQGAIEEVETDTTNSKVFLHPFDDPNTMSGQATIMQETLRQMELAGYDLQTAPVDIVVPGGGKGLAAGCAVWLAREQAAGRVGEQVRMTIVEVENKETSSFCDSTMTSDGQNTSAILEYLGSAETITVTETEVAQAMHELHGALGKAVEPAGALATAGTKKLATRYARSTLQTDGTATYGPAHTFVSVVSGANVSQETQAEAQRLRDEDYFARLQGLGALTTAWYNEVVDAEVNPARSHQSRVASSPVRPI